MYVKYLEQLAAQAEGSANVLSPSPAAVGHVLSNFTSVRWAVSFSKWWQSEEEK